MKDFDEALKDSGLTSAQWAAALDILDVFKPMIVRDNKHAYERGYADGRDGKAPESVRYRS